MFELNIDVNVKLHTGAVITLTEDQTRRIKNHVVEVVLGNTQTKVEPSVKKKKTGRKGWQTWDATELASIDELVNKYSFIKKNQVNKMRTAELKELAKLLNRKFTAVAAVYYNRNSERMAREKIAKQLNDPTNWTPVTINK